MVTESGSLYGDGQRRSKSHDLCRGPFVI